MRTRGDSPRGLAPASPGERYQTTRMVERRNARLSSGRNREGAHAAPGSDPGVADACQSIWLGNMQAGASPPVVLTLITPRADSQTVAEANEAIWSALDAAEVAKQQNSRAAGPCRCWGLPA